MMMRYYFRILSKFFLSIYLLVKDIVADNYSDRGVRNYSENIELDLTLTDFKKKRNIFSNSNIPQQDINASNTLSYNGKQYFIDEIITPVQVFTDSANYVIDGTAAPCPPTYIFEKDNEEEIVTVYKNNQQEVILVTIFDKFTKETIEIPRIDNESRFATVRSANMDFDDLNERFKYSDNDFSNRLLRGVSQTERKTSDTWLQVPCDKYRVIQLAVHYESAFCANNGGRSGADDKVLQLVASVSKKFQQADLCIKVQLSNLGGYCNQESDPYDIILKTNEQGCSGLILRQIRAIFEEFEGENDVKDYDAMHLFTGNPIGCDGEQCYIGCAGTASMCKINAYGVVYPTYSDSENLQAVAVAHELGHIAGANHDEILGYIMQHTIGSASLGFSPQSVNSINNKKSEWDSRPACVEDEISQPTIASILVPSAAPTSKPSILLSGTSPTPIENLMNETSDIGLRPTSDCKTSIHLLHLLRIFFPSDL